MLDQNDQKNINSQNNAMKFQDFYFFKDID